ncbi:Alanine--tRNA ligase [bacterium AB1]|nr:Alanine--tRNA ligase [bacterium AB1]
MNKKNIIKSFIDFFSSKGYISSINNNVFNNLSQDILFNNSGIAGLFHYFDQNNVLNLNNKNIYATVQKCVRISGKHNDINEIGDSKTHATSFYMLGTFMPIVGDLQKTIIDIYSFLKLFLEEKNMYITIHPECQRALEVWLKLIPRSKIRYDISNTWQMSNQYGYKGYCTEIMYNYLGCEVEVWNIVIIDKFIENGIETDLDHIKIDTGGGLERLNMILNDDDSIYDDESFWSVFSVLAHHNDSILSREKNIIIDHIMTIDAIVFSNIHVSNVGRGYILRKLMRRLFLYFYKYNLQIEKIVYSMNNILLSPLDTMSILFDEYALFINLISVFQKYINSKKVQVINNKKILTVENIVYLHGTLGVSYYLVELLSINEKDIVIENKNVDYYDLLKENNVVSNKYNFSHIIQYIEKNSFSQKEFNYDIMSQNTGLIIFNNEKQVFQCNINDEYYVLNVDNFVYPTSGGQEYDRGTVIFNNQKVFSITNVINYNNINIIFVKCLLSFSFESSSSFLLQVDEHYREVHSINHTLTHIIGTICQKYFFNTIHQISSKICYNCCKISFYFGNEFLLTSEKLLYLLKKEISKNLILKRRKMYFYDAVKNNYKYLNKENYKIFVNVVEIYDKDTNQLLFKDICGGTHSVNFKDYIKSLQLTVLKINKHAYSINYGIK